MKKIIDFLRRLAQHNDRAWFGAHKQEYLDCKEMFDAFVVRLIDGIRSFDPSIGDLSVKDCTYRIYRDTRFSADKSPYKIHMGAFVAPKGKKSGFSGYYLQVGPHAAGYDGGVMLAAGDYCCEPRVLKLLREDIAYDEGAAFGAAIATATGFTLDWSQALKRVPAGFDADKPYSQWLRLKNYCLVKEPGVEYATAPDFLERALADFRTTEPFISFINRAIDYSQNPS